MNSQGLWATMKKFLATTTQGPAVIAALLLVVQTAAAAPRVLDFRADCVNQAVLTLIGMQPLVPLPQQIARLEVSPASLSGKADNASRNLNVTMDFFAKELGWSSVDGKGAPITLSANLGLGQSCDGLNAFYSHLGPGFIHLITVQYGHPQSTLDLGNDLEVLGHEFTHGVFRATQGNDEGWEKGGINEGVADMFGVTIRAWYESGQKLASARIREDSFKLGRNLATIATDYYDKGEFFPQGYMRNLLNPYPWHVADHVDLLNYPEYQEVHAASGVVSLPFALLVKGGRHPRLDSGIQVQPIGFEKAIKIAFYTLKHKLPFNTMTDFSAAMQKAARKIYGADSAEYASVQNAFAVTGLASAHASTQTDSSAPAAGNEEPADSPEAPETSPEAPETGTNESPPLESPAPVPETADSETSVDTGEVPSRGVSISGPIFMVVLFVFLLGLMFLAQCLAANRRKVLSQGYRGANQANSFEPGNQPTPASSPISAGSASVSPASPANTASSVANDSLDITLQVHGQSFNLKLDAEPLKLGRGEQLELPGKLFPLLAQDQYIGRDHCSIWYQAQTRQLYVLCHSANGLKLNGHAIGNQEKAKVNVTSDITLEIGKTVVHLLMRQ